MPQKQGCDPSWFGSWVSLQVSHQPGQNRVFRALGFWVHLHTEELQQWVARSYSVWEDTVIGCHSCQSSTLSHVISSIQCKAMNFLCDSHHFSSTRSQHSTTTTRTWSNPSNTWKNHSGKRERLGLECVCFNSWQIKERGWRCCLRWMQRFTQIQCR